ncbi:MAG: phosphate ABC transporter substrate-binding protein [Defluviitaleaceae bacterium]|nr:phosphate ABC transporter substrate-binding protein [Defluviitaleaceae bacterium]
MKKWILVVALAVVSAFLFAGCRPEDAGSDNIIVAGSTTITPVMREIAEAFESANNGLTVEIQELGTSAGINATIEGISDIAMSSRAMSADEQAQGVHPIPFAIDGVAVVVNPNNPVSDLTLEQITAIFYGEITNWSEVGGNDVAITVVSREEGSGIRSTFESFANIDEVSSGAIISQGTGGVIASVSSNVNAIGYVTTGVVSDGLKAVAINGVMFSETTVMNGSYIFANTFFIGIRDDLSDNAQRFVDFILSSPGQDVVSAAGYVRIQ